MTNREALRIVKDGDFGSDSMTPMCLNCDDCMDDECRKCIDEAFNLAYEALEKQIPKKPKMRVYGIHDEDNGDYLGEEERYYCPSCINKTHKLNHSSEIPCGKNCKNDWYSHCHRCGQAIDWSEER